MDNEAAINRMAGALMADERFDFMQDFSIDQVKAMMRTAYVAEHDSDAPGGTDG